MSAHSVTNLHYPQEKQILSGLSVKINTSFCVLNQAEAGTAVYNMYFMGI